MRILLLLLTLCTTTVLCQQDITKAQELINEGNDLNKAQKFDNAILKYLEATKILENLGDSVQLATVYSNIGAVNARLKNFDKAILYLEKATSYITTDNNLKLRATYNISGIHLEKKDFKTSLIKAKEAEKLALKLKNDQILSAIYSFYCNYYRDLKAYKKAINYGLKSYELKKRLKLNPDITINNIGYGYLLNGDYTKAIEYLSKITNTSNETLRTYVFNNLKNAYEELGQSKKALEYANKYITLKDTLTLKQQRVKVAEITEKYEATKKQQEIINLETENQLKESKLQNQNNWFWGIGVFAVLLGFTIFFWFQKKKIQQDLEKASIQHKLLRNQLNPHFLFHSLNSIQSFIYQNKKEKSVNYLVNYSKLMRAIFDTSDNDFISIEDDKNTIENYLALQKLTTNNEIEFHINFDNEISDYKIPPMFIQPFVENAIQHGIGNNINGKVSVEYSQQDDIITIIVSDNGNGFNPSKSNNTLHKLSSSKVIKKRIENLQKTHKYTIKIDTISNKQGSTVMLTFPKKH